MRAEAREMERERAHAHLMKVASGSGLRRQTPQGDFFETIDLQAAPDDSVMMRARPGRSNTFETTALINHGALPV